MTIITDSEAKKNASVRIEQLTGLRFFAALLVFLSHIPWQHDESFWAVFFQYGFVGVSFFFVLSGFVLSRAYSEKISNEEISFQRYAALRLARLAPLHLFTALPFIVYALSTSSFNLPAAIANITFLQSWFPSASFYFSLNSPSWSLSNEMFFYVCFFFLVPLSDKRLCFIMISLLALIASAAVITEEHFSQRIVFGSQTFSHWLFYIFPGFRLLEFICGMLLYRLWKTFGKINPVLIPIAYCVLFASMYVAPVIPESYRLSLFFLPAVALLLYAHLYPRGIIFRLYTSKLLVLLGNASFAFYLIHQPLIKIIYSDAAPLSLSHSGHLTASLVVALFLSVLIHLTIEKAATNFLKVKILQHV